MSIKLKPLRLAAAAFLLWGPALLCAPALLSTPAYAVDLVGVHDLAVQSDPRLQAAAFRREATGENKAIARANLLPQIGAGGAWSRGDSETDIPGFDQTIESDIDTDNYRLELRQSLYRQANYEALDVARGQISQADAIYQIAYQDFLLRVAERYFLVLTLTDGVTFAEAEEKAFQRQFEQAEQRFEVGLTAVTDVHEARATYDNARARAIVARNDLEDAKEALRELTGQYFDAYDPLQEVLPLVEPDPIAADDWVDIALQNNPSVLSSRAAVDIADANMRLARAGHFPTLDLVGSYNQFGNNKYLYTDQITGNQITGNLEAEDSQLQLTLTVPFYQGGRVSAQTRQARDLLDASGRDLDDVQRGVVRQTQTAYRAVIAGIQEVEAFQQASVSAESALEATQAGFEVGTRTIVDVLIAEQRKYQAQRDNSVARHAYIIRHLRLKSVAGLLEAEDLRVVNQLLQ
jgi:outer membrane protein